MATEECVQFLKCNITSAHVALFEQYLIDCAEVITLSPKNQTGSSWDDPSAAGFSCGLWFTECFEH